MMPAPPRARQPGARVAPFAGHSWASCWPRRGIGAASRRWRRGGHPWGIRGAFVGIALAPTRHRGGVPPVAPARAGRTRARPSKAEAKPSWRLNAPASHSREPAKASARERRARLPLDLPPDLGYVPTRPGRPGSSAPPPPSAQVAQLVEQRTENPRVGGSIPPLGTIFSNEKTITYEADEAQEAVFSRKLVAAADAKTRFSATQLYQLFIADIDTAGLESRNLADSQAAAIGQREQQLGLQVARAQFLASIVSRSGIAFQCRMITQVRT